MDKCLVWMPVAVVCLLRKATQEIVLLRGFRCVCLVFCQPDTEGHGTSEGQNDGLASAGVTMEHCHRKMNLHDR